MTIQEAARIILEEFGKPMRSKEIAKIALERRMVDSDARDPVSSHAQTIEKNIREDVYNKTGLIFFGEPRRGRKIGLPFMEDKSSLSAHKSIKSDDNVELRVRIPADLFENVQLAAQAKFASSFDDTVTVLLRKGLAATAQDIKKRLINQLNKFEGL
jgi:hypothetical protein